MQSPLNFRRKPRGFYGQNGTGQFIEENFGGVTKDQADETFSGDGSQDYKVGINVRCKRCDFFLGFPLEKVKAGGERSISIFADLLS